MSKADLFKQLETLNPRELEEAAHRIADLLYEADAEDDLTPAERAIIDERMARAAANPGKAEEWAVVRERVRREIKE